MIDALLIPLAGIAVPIVIVPVVMGLKHARLERELEHAERMKALELGRTLPQDEPWWTPLRVSLAFGVGVPIGVSACAAFATVFSGFQDGIWVGSMAVGVCGVLSGSWLASRQIGASRRQDGAFVKPHVVDDLFDMAGNVR